MRQTKPGLTALPIEQTDALVRLTGEQENLLGNLENASEKAAAIL